VGVEPSSVFGHLGDGEPMMKPHFTKCGLLLMKGGDSWQGLISQNLISEADRYNYTKKNK
jgi:hypothetical protein